MVWTRTDRKELPLDHHGDHKDTNGRLQLRLSPVEKNRFSPVPPFNNLPGDQHFGQQKEEEKGTRDTSILFLWTIPGDTGRNTFEFDCPKRLQSFLISQTGQTIKNTRQQKIKRQGTISMIELFDVLLAITSVLSLVTCTIWCNRCVLEWRLRRRARRRNPGIFRKPAPVTPTKHVVEKPEPLGATPEPEHIYMEIDLEQPPPWDSVAPPPYTRTEATQISYI